MSWDLDIKCHHCGARQAAPPACPDCGGLALQPQGIGTERLEELLAEQFADVPVLRVDRGTTQKRDGLAQQLSKLGEMPGILVGTQILAKGHDLPHLTRVAVVGVDEGLFSTDFRAGEKLAQPQPPGQRRNARQVGALNRDETGRPGNGRQVNQQAHAHLPGAPLAAVEHRALGVIEVKMGVRHGVYPQITQIFKKAGD